MVQSHSVTPSGDNFIVLHEMIVPVSKFVDVEIFKTFTFFRLSK